jgi:hypothetical protein
VIDRVDLQGEGIAVSGHSQIITSCLDRSR